MLQARRRFSRRSGREPSPPRSSTRRSPVCSRASAQLRSWRWWRLVTRRLRRRLFGVVARAVGGKLAGEILKYTSRLRVKLFRAAKHFAGFSGIAWRNFDDLGGTVGDASDYVRRKPANVLCGCFASGTVVWTAVWFQNANALKPYVLRAFKFSFARMKRLGGCFALPRILHSRSALEMLSRYIKPEYAPENIRFLSCIVPVFWE